MAVSRNIQMQNQMRKMADQDKVDKIIIDMAKEYDELCEKYKDLPADFIHHTHNNIFPVVITYDALMNNGYSKEDALNLTEKAFLDLMNEPAEAICKMMKVPGLYNIMPWLWKVLMPKLFSEQAGFAYQYHEQPKGIKFDIIKCPYLTLCEKLGYPELAPIFCATDDLCYSHMHKYLKFTRTNTMARGAELCDFDLKIDKNNKK